MAGPLGVSCNGFPVTGLDDLEAACKKAANCTVACPVLFPEVPLGLRAVLRALGLGALTVEVCGHVFTAIHGFFPSQKAWAAACAAAQALLPRGPVEIASKYVTVGAETLRAHIAAARVPLAPPRLGPGDVRPRVATGGAIVPPDQWADVARVTPPVLHESGRPLHRSETA